MGPEDSPAAGESYSKVLQGRYELGRVLGRGGSSKVYRARDIRTGVSVAVKAVRKPHHPCSPEKAAAARRSVERELAALRRVQGHPHVMRLLDVLASRSTVYLVLELARGGTLLSAMDERGRFDEPTSRRLFVQLVSALAHVHSRGVFHRDVKPENLLLDEHGDLKLTDFGLCALADRHLRADGLAATRCGSPAYVAPEILYKKRYDAGKVDIFSGRFRCPRWFSPELRSLVGRMLDPDAGTRIKMDEIMEHPWLQQDGTSSFDIIRAPSSDPRPEVMKWEAEMEQVRELNAFDIIAFASGCDLSGLFGPLPDRVRFAVVGVVIASVLDKAEEIGREEGFVMRRKEEVGCGGIMFEAIQREIIAMVRIFSGRFRCPRWFSPELRGLVGRMLDPNPDSRIKIAEIMEHSWLQLDGTSSFGNIIRAGSSDPRPEVTKWEAEMEQVRELNAFDIIALASGCDLSGLLGPLPDRVRFAVVGVDIGSVLDKAEEIGREDGFVMRRKEEVGCGGIMFEAIGREIIALVRVSRLLEEMVMIEVERASSSEAPNLWKRLQLGLKFSNN
uniref:non-specific serine/threonine protein kinase n=1 Tax=Aegilops tauschii TaxID=37682 RepID=M8C6X3_AEGTA